MKNPLEAIAKRNETGSVKVVDGKLIMSFPDAITPVLWQMDLSEAKASALEVHEDEENKSHTLTLKTPRGEAVGIASFEERSHAVDGLMAASRALESAHGHIRPGANPPAQNGKQTPAPHQTHTPGKGKWVGVIIGIAFIFVLMTLWGTLVPRSSTGLSTASTSFGGSGAQNATGVPVSADDFLRGQ